jgi:hypothetical protein
VPQIRHRVHQPHMLAGHSLPHEYSWCSFLLQVESTPGHCATEGISDNYRVSGLCPLSRILSTRKWFFFCIYNSGRWAMSRSPITVRVINNYENRLDPTGRIRLNEDSNDLTQNWTCDLSTCTSSMVPQLTMLPYSWSLQYVADSSCSTVFRPALVSAHNPI